MFSRARLLIEKEIQKFTASPPWGIEIQQVNDSSYFEWIAKIHGLKDTLWESGVFQVYIKFNEHFNVQPPKVNFQTIPFHPNIDMQTGQPCVDYLDNVQVWQPSFSLSMLLVTLQMMLSNPNLDSAINVKAVEIMMRSPHTYNQIILECVASSQRIEAGKSMQINQTFLTSSAPDGTINLPTPRTASAHITRLSFDDYLQTWRYIATSKPTEDTQNLLLERVQQKPELQKVHIALPQAEVEEQIKKNMVGFRHLMYGRLKNNKLAAEQERDDKITQLQNMRKMYLPPQKHSLTPTLQTDVIMNASTLGLESKEEWEKEVDALVSWTNNLDTTAIDT